MKIRVDKSTIDVVEKVMSFDFYLPAQNALTCIIDLYDRDGVGRGT